MGIELKCTHVMQALFVSKIALLRIIF